VVRFGVGPTGVKFCEGGDLSLDAGGQVFEFGSRAAEFGDVGEHVHGSRSGRKIRIATSAIRIAAPTMSSTRREFRM
jgi:hypothetical protein